jgi:hypothetical protein
MIDLVNRDALAAPASVYGSTVYFQAILDACQRAFSNSGVIDQSYAIAGQHIELRFAGPDLVPCITPALSHLRVHSPHAPALTVGLFDSASTRVPVTLPTRDQVWSYENESLCILLDPGSNSASLLDRAQRLALFWIPSAAHFSYHEAGFPLRHIIRWWMGPLGLQLVHAGVVGNAHGGVLLPGKSGSGKSTTTLACLESGLDYVGDDFVLLAAKPEPYAYGVYNSAKLNPPDLPRFPALTPLVRNRARLDTEKALFFLQERFPERIKTGLPVRALLVPRVMGATNTRVRPLRAAEGLTALAASTILLFRGAGAEDLERMSEVVKKIPCFVLELGSDLAQIPAAISNLLSELSE